MISNKIIKVQKAELNGYDISKSIRNITLFNDIENIGYSLDILYNDITNIKDLMPLRGGEELDLIIVNNDKFSKKFILTNISKFVVDVNTEYLKLNFVSSDSFWLSVNRLYQSWNKDIKTIINDIQSSNVTLIDSTKQQIIIPGWTKTKAIKYILSNYTKDSLFFENSKEFICNSLNDLIVDSKEEYTPDNKNSHFKNLILDINYKNTFDVLDDSYYNLYKRKIIAYNPNTKEFKETENKIEDIQKENNTTGSGRNFNPDISDNIEVKEIVVPYLENLDDVKSVMHKMFNRTIEMLVHGNIFLEVGSTIRLNMGERYNKSEPNKSDSGIWLVTKVAHHISKDEFFTKVELKKNAPQKDVDVQIYEKAVM